MDQNTNEIRQAIEEDRAEIAETIHELASRADLKERMKDAASERTARVRHQADALARKARQLAPTGAQQSANAAWHTIQRRPAPLAIAMAAVLGLLFWLKIKK